VHPQFHTNADALDPSSPIYTDAAHRTSHLLSVGLA
jgi:hypothetical protein